MNKKISDLSADLMGLYDIVPIVDVSANETKKISLDTLRSWSSLSSGSVSLQGKSLLLNKSDRPNIGYCLQNGSPVNAAGGGGYVPALTLDTNSTNKIRIRDLFPSRVQQLVNSYPNTTAFSFTFIKIDYIVYSSTNDFGGLGVDVILESGVAYILGDIADFGTQPAEINVNKTITNGTYSTGTWSVGYNISGELEITIPFSGSPRVIAYIKTFTTAL